MDEEVEMARLQKMKEISAQNQSKKAQEENPYASKQEQFADSEEQDMQRDLAQAQGEDQSYAAFLNVGQVGENMTYLKDKVVPGPRDISMVKKTMRNGL